MSRALFITGTDTGCGKTTISVALAERLAACGHSVACFKPVAAGCEPSPDGLRNDDALKLQQAATLDLDYDQVNPVALAPAIAPHIAANQSGQHIDIVRIAADIRSINADIRLVEGAGGWMVPLSDETMTADLVKQLEAEVILVVGMRLGCINHALLSARAIAADGLKLAGWIANRLDPDQSVQSENIQTIANLLGPPLAEFSLAEGWSKHDGLARLHT